MEEKNSDFFEFPGFLGATFQTVEFGKEIPSVKSDNIEEEIEDTPLWDEDLARERFLKDEIQDRVFTDHDELLQLQRRPNNILSLKSMKKHFVSYFPDRFISHRVFSFIMPLGNLLLNGICLFLLYSYFNDHSVRSQVTEIRLLLMQDVKERLNSVFQPFSIHSVSIHSHLKILEDTLEVDYSDFNTSAIYIQKSLVAACQSLPVGMGECRVGFGLEKNGDFLAVESVNGTTSLISIDPVSRFIISNEIDQKSGKITRFNYNVTKPYDPRVTSWYHSGKSHPQNSTSSFTWGKFFKTYSNNITITTTKPYYDDNNSFIGVVTSLMYLDNFFTHPRASLKNDENQWPHINSSMDFLILNSEGFLIGSSYEGLQYVNITSKVSSDGIFKLHEHPTTFLRDLGAFLLYEFISYDLISETGTREINFKAQGDIKIVEIDIWRDNNGMRLYVVLLLSRNELYRFLYQSYYYSLFTIGICLIFAIGVSIIISCWITEPVGKIYNRLNSITTLNNEFKLLFNKKKPQIHELKRVYKSISELNIMVCNLKKFVPQPIINRYNMKQNITKRLLTREKISIIFINALSFSQISHNIPDTSYAMLLTDFYCCIERCVEKYNGYIVNFMEDTVTILFAKSDDNNAEEALSCVLSIVNEIKSITLPSTSLITKKSEKKKKKNFFYRLSSEYDGVVGVEEKKKKFEKKKCLKISVGVNSGECLVGIIGTSKRFQYMPFGDVVTNAVNLEMLNKKYGTSVLMGENTYNAVKDRDDVIIKYVDKIKFKGKNKPLRAYKLIGGSKNLIL